MARNGDREALRQKVGRWQEAYSQRGARQRPGPPPEVEAKPLYTSLDLDGLDEGEALGVPGEYPYTRGIRSDMYLGRVWTMRQYAGYGTVSETNRRFRHLLEQGLTGMNVAFDLPTQLGMDPDHPEARGEVGKVGITCPSLEQMQRLFQGIPLDKVNPSLTVNAPVQAVLSTYLTVGQEQGIPLGDLTGTTQNDILKEFIARGNYVYPPGPSVGLTVDVLEFTTRHVPRWNYMNVCGYHIREAGASLVQEVAFAFADALTYVDAALERGLHIDEFAPRIAWNFSIFNNVLEEVAKFRAARRLWARLMKGRYGAQKPASWTFRTGAGSGGSTLMAQQPENNIVRVALHTVIAAAAGVQSMHTAAMDEALALPSEHAATLALRTQQVIAHESGLADIIDPLGGSYALESLTDRIEEEVTAYLQRVEDMGGMVAALESGWVHRQIAEHAYAFQRQVEQGERVIVGVNRYTTGETPPVSIHRADPRVAEQVQRELADMRRRRDDRATAQALRGLEGAARRQENLMPFTMEAVRAWATVGEVSDALRGVFGEYRAPTD